MREVTSCPVCAGRERSVLYPSTIPAEFIATGQFKPYAAHYCINRCGGCNLLFSNPVLDEEQVNALYEQSDETNVVAGEEDNVRRTMQHYYNLLRPHLARRGRMLDVGCDRGILLGIAQTDGFEEVAGIEPNPTAREIAEAELQTPISARFYEQQEYPEQYFDAVTMIHVLDHLFDPRAVLERAWRNLRPGGVVMAVVHNVESLLGRLLGERFPVFNLYHHFFFSKKTLSALAESCGYEVLAVPSTMNCYSTGFFVEKLPVVPASLKRMARTTLEACGIGRLPLALPIGNIAVIARRPREGANAKQGRLAA